MKQKAINQAREDYILNRMTTDRFLRDVYAVRESWNAAADYLFRELEKRKHKSTNSLNWSDILEIFGREE
jgi:hypothetical protein